MTLTRSRIVGAVLIVFAAAPLRAAGLSTPFVDVKVKGVVVGKPYIVKDSAADGILLQNLEPTPVRVTVQAFPPAPTDLRGDAVAIPDMNWVHITPSEVTVPPHGRVICRVTLKLPRDAQYRHKTYQVMIWSRSQLEKTQGVGLSAGLISRLRFTTE